MRQLKLFNRLPSADLALFVVTFLIYLFYFFPIFSNLNSVLSGVTLDTLKNYYTYVYHTTTSENWLTFQGMNYPFGEHLVYTDCQPLLCWILRPLPFCHPYLIGILHFLMFFSFIITPNILYRIFLRTKIDKWPAAIFALGIGLLSPQFLKIQAGHHTLSYACIIPITILCLQKLMQEGGRKNQMLLFTFNLLLYFIHPYFGFSVSIFSFFALVFHGLFNVRSKKITKACLTAALVALLPLLLFKVFMILTDSKTDRPEEPIGVNFMIENIHSLLSPDFGPFKNPTEKILTKKPPHFEGHTYLGFATIMITIFLTFILIVKRRKPNIDKSALAIILSASILLFLAFGYHFDVLELLKISSHTFNQFRATCRFAWFFYYALPVFVIPILYSSFSAQYFLNKILPALFLLSCLIESRYLFKHDEDAYWKFDNVFNEKFLTGEQKQILEQIRASNSQAIIPLPIFHGGSELYDRLGSNNSMTPAMLFSFHSKLPLLSVSLSRTSAKETEALIESLNAYKKHRTVDALFNGKDFLLLKTKDSLLPDEKRLLQKSKLIGRFDSLALYKVSAYNLKTPMLSDSSNVINGQIINDNAIFIPTSSTKPFAQSNLMNAETIFSSDKNKIPASPQVISLHLHYKRKHFKAIAGDLIIASVTEKGSEWIKNIPLRILSGFYPGYAVFEYEVNLSPNEKYQFIIQGWQDEDYSISDFMIRSAQQTVILKNGMDTASQNNFPLQ